MAILLLKVMLMIMSLAMTVEMIAQIRSIEQERQTDDHDIDSKRQ